MSSTQRYLPCNKVPFRNTLACEVGEEEEEVEEEEEEKASGLGAEEVVVAVVR